MPRRLALLFIMALALAILLCTVIFYRFNPPPENRDIITHIGKPKSSTATPSASASAFCCLDGDCKASNTGHESHQSAAESSSSSSSGFGRFYLMSTEFPKEWLERYPLLADEHDVIRVSKRRRVAADVDDDSEDDAMPAAAAAAVSLQPATDDLNRDDGNHHQDQKQEKESELMIELCQNTDQGPEWVTDSRGFMCKIENVHAVSGCCIEPTSDSPILSTIRHFICRDVIDNDDNDFQGAPSSTCRDSDNCCLSYEQCVSCCMSPSNREFVHRQYALLRHRRERLFDHITTLFQFCGARCRTSSHSIRNQRRYKSPFKHCFNADDLVQS